MRTPDDVITRTGIRDLEDYVDVGPMADCAGFHVQRFYPRDSQLGRVLTNAGEPALSCLLQFIVDPLATPGGSTRVRVHTHLHDRSHLLVGVWPPLERRPLITDEPNAPTQESVALFRRAHHPLSLEYLDSFLYDASESTFLDGNGDRVSVKEILDQVYNDHCRTYQRVFAWKWRLRSPPRTAASKFTWGGTRRVLVASLQLLRYRARGRKRSGSFGSVSRV
jgi:hypothetical protein